MYEEFAKNNSISSAYVDPVEENLRKRRSEVKTMLEDACRNASSEEEKVALQEIQGLPEETEQQIDFKVWLYNYGHFRQQEEIEKEVKRINDINYRNSKQYQKDMNTKCWWIFLIPPAFFTTFSIICYLLTHYSDKYYWWSRQDFGIDIFSIALSSAIDGWFIVDFLCFPISMIICGAIVAKIRENHALSHGASKNDPLVKKQRVTQAVCAVGAGVCAAATAKKVKEYNKEMMHPETWRN